SVNWASCSRCGSVQPYMLGDLLLRRGGPPIDKSLWTPHQTLTISEYLDDVMHCSEPCRAEAVIVPPTWNKGRYHDARESVWRRAAKELSEAEKVIIIGYSLPSTDQFFHFLFGLGCVGRNLLRRVIVCNPDPDVGDRFRQLLAPSVVNGGFTHLHSPFST